MAVGFFFFFFFPSFKGVAEYLSQECSFSKKPFFSQTAEEKTKAPFQSCSSADIIKVRRESGNSHLSATSFLLQEPLSGSNISRLFSSADTSDAGGCESAAAQRSALHGCAATEASRRPRGDCVSREARAREDSSCDEESCSSLCCDATHSATKKLSQAQL